MSEYVREVLGMEPLKMGRPSSMKKNEQQAKAEAAKALLHSAERRVGLR